MIEISKSESNWLQRFFAGDNDLAWTDVVNETGPLDRLAQVLPWLQFMQKTPLEHPLVLPVYASDGATRWYGLAENAQIAAQMTQELQGFIGPSYSTFDGHMCELSSSDPMEAVLRERFGPLAVRFEPTSGEDRKEVERQLLLYQSVLARRPPVANRGQRPFGQVRGDFDRALLAGNASGAERFLDELCASGRVSADQRKYLEIRCLAGLGKYEELARSHALIVSVMELPLPPQTLVDLVEALHKTYIAEAEQKSDFELIQKTFKQHIARSYGPLFRERKGVRQPEVLRAFLLYESVLQPASLARCEALMQAYPRDAAGRELAEKILESIRRARPIVREDTLDRVKQAIADEDYAFAVDLCFKALPEPWTYCALLRCGLEMDSESITTRVLETIDRADERIRRAFTKRDRERLEELRARTQRIQRGQHLADWITWARWVLTEPQGVSPISALETAVVTWSVVDYVRDTDNCNDLAQMIGNARGVSEKTFREAFPQLVEFFVEKPERPVRAFAPIYLILIKIMAWGGTASADELRLGLSITEALLATGLDATTYAECLQDLSEILNANNAPTNLDWALDLAELLILVPAPTKEARLRIFMATLDMVRNWGHRITQAQRALLELLARDYECRELVDTFPQPKAEGGAQFPATAYSGSIAIYTLSESSGQRAKHTLNSLFPSAKIELNADTVATERLRNLARNADIFVFAWKKSSHQAYYCVKDVRGSDKLIMATGGGSASLVRSVTDHVYQKAV